MKKIFSLLLVAAMATSVMAIPARRGWQTRTAADGTTIEVQQMGDEFYHYMVNRDGQEVREIDGMYQVVGEAPTAEVAKARRAKGVARRQRAEVGTTPYPAPRGLLILANFADTKYKSTNTAAVMDSLITAVNCQVNGGHGSAAQYFKDQSDGQYQPIFDVYGPVTLSKKAAYYGGNEGYGDNAQDSLATDAVIEACILANQQYEDLNFADYDWNQDGYVDFVYVIYAGKGEADGGASSTIWPHNYSIQDVVKGYQYGWTHYQKSDTKLDGVYLDNYAMSQELNGQTGARAGNGVFCHEFGHVIGLPDFYDTQYGTNYESAITPNDWDIMDGGGYNDDGHCPPNYSPWEKYFMGWHTPINLGNNGQALELIANGKEGYQAYQINTSGTQQTATTAGECFYIENRQQQGWDEALPSHGMLIWKVNFNASAWSSNTPNNTANNPRYTIVSASGTKIGTHADESGYYYEYDGPKNPFPGSAKVTSKTIAGKPLTDIKEANGVISLVYIEVQVDPFDVVWMANGEEFATTSCPGKVVLPSTEPEACEGWVFAGWCDQAEYSDAKAPTFVKAGNTVSEGTIFYAVYALPNGEEVSAAVEDVLTRETTGVSGTSYTDWSNKTLTSSAVYAGNSAGGKGSIQLRSTGSTSGIITTASGGKISKVTVEWNEAETADERKLDIYGNNEAYSAASDLYSNAKKGTKLGTLLKGETEFIIDGDYTFVGVRSYNGALYLSSITFTWGGSAGYSLYSTTCGPAEGIEDVIKTPAAQKILRDGHVLIIRNGVIYDLNGRMTTAL